MKNTAGTPKAESNHVAASSPTAKPSEPDAGSQAASSSSSDGDLAQYRDMLAHLQLEINNRDLNALHLDVFTATSFSNLYRDPAKDSSYFSKSKSFLFVEISQTIFSNLNLDTYGLLKFQSSSTVSADQAKDVLAATSGFGAEWGLIKWLNKKGRSDREFDFGIIAGGGAEAFVPVDSAGAAVPNKADQFHPVYRAGLVIKQNAGAWEGSYSEFSFLHDPRFVDERRLLARVRAVVSPPLASGGGKGLGAYVEGSLNAGRGRDEARVTVGIRVDALGVLRALVGAGNVGSPSTPAGDPSSKTSSK